MTVRFSETQFTVAEDAGSITVTVEMIGESDIPIEVNVSTSPISATSKLSRYVSLFCYSHRTSILLASSSFFEFMKKSGR